MKDGMLVFDASVHCQDFSDNQIKRGSDGRRVQILRDHQERFINITGRRGPPPETETFSNPDLDWGNEMLFGKSDTDLASACSVPLFAHWKAGLGPVEMSHALALNGEASECSPVRAIASEKDQYCVKVASSGTGGAPYCTSRARDV